MDAVTALFPICRSITGNGLRQTLSYIKKHIGSDIIEVASGTQVFDWVVPDEWNITDAYVKNADGVRVIDFQESNLSVVNFSEPVHGSFSLEELRNHLHTIPDQPNAVPYVTSYYKRTWGFCLSTNTLKALEDGAYDVHIDSTIEPGSLSYGELLVKGSSNREILISCHCCHPSLANDNLSGITVAMALAKSLQKMDTKLSYRFLFLPGTIGAITWLATHTELLPNIVGGLTLANLGDSAFFNYKRSRQGDSQVDQAFEYVLQSSGKRFGIRDFSPYGYDERQYCSPGINLAVGSFTRSVHGTFDEYHTSNDNLSFVSEDNLEQSLSILEQVVFVLENDDTYMNMSPMGEPQLGKRGLYSEMGGYSSHPDQNMAYLWVLNMSDGNNSLLQISRKSGIEFRALVEASSRLLDAGLLEAVK